uniref:von Willebrand factor D and EGF domain-containing protein-like n=1 Tax=Saccoglossus kowalevskii TaxID=10224 RepID=A0ABM0M098_SACKO|nr:PREDICTED: von Willebrand factor D and EGF domain-containing protein-like [Saccoglossus kowalevskii]
MQNEEKLIKGQSLFDNAWDYDTKYSFLYPKCKCLKDPLVDTEVSIQCEHKSVKGNQPIACSLDDNKRSVDSAYNDYELFDPEQFELPEEEDDLVPVVIAWPTPSNITEEEARQKCLLVIYESNIANYCEELEELRDTIDQTLQDCVADIQLADSFFAVDSARTTMENACQVTVSKNTSLWEENEEGELAPPASVMTAVCPSHCSGNGNCTMEGKCICKHGFTGPGCSIETGKPPEMFGFVGSSICDVRKRPCERISVDVAGIINSDNLTCHVREMQFTNGKWIETGESFKAIGVYAGAYTLFCYLPVSRVRRQVVSPVDEGSSTHGMRISVSNDGTVESNGTLFVTYDSLCLNCSTSEDCQQKDNTCLISDSSCDTSEVELTTSDVAIHPDESDTNNIWLLPLSIGLFIAIAAVVTVGVLLKKYIVKKKKNTSVYPLHETCGESNDMKADPDVLVGGGKRK